MMTKQTMILIPPSEGKQPGGSHPPLKKVSPEVREMIESLQTEGGSGKVLDVKGAALEKALETNRTIFESPTLPAIERYTGVVYEAINYHSLTPDAKTFFDENVRVVSAVFGLVRPRDLIPDYKLKINKLGADKHWKPWISKMLKDVFVMDLLPQAHRKAVEYENGLKVDFVVIRNKKAVAAGHQGKHIKGRFIRWLCERQCRDPKDFKNFQQEGFAWKDGRFVKQA